MVVLSSFGIAELLTGSTRPLLLVSSPAIFWLIVALYGCGVLSVRELALHWGGGWSTLLALGAAFGVLEEGLVARSIFDPGWSDLDVLAGYGRWAGVNWVWAVYLAIFHALFSVAIPVALTGLAFPAGRRAPWLSERGRRRVAAGLVAVTAIGLLGVNPGAGSPPALAGAAVVVVALGLLGRALARARRCAAPRCRSTLTARRLGLLGFAGSAVLFLLAWGTPSTGLPAGVALALLLAGALAAALVSRRIARRALNPGQQLALIGGAIGWLALVDLALVGARPDTAALVVVAALALLHYRRQVTTPTAAPQSRSRTEPDGYLTREPGPDGIGRDDMGYSDD